MAQLLVRAGGAGRRSAGRPRYTPRWPGPATERPRRKSPCSSGAAASRRWRRHRANRARADRANRGQRGWAYEELPVYRGGFSASARSIHLANSQFLIGIRTGQSGRAGTPCDNPVDVVVFRETIEIAALKVLPPALRFDLLLPVFRQLGKQGHGAAVFDVVGHRAPLGNCTKAMLVLAVPQHVIRVERKQGILGRMVAHPKKSGGPVLAITGARPFDMRTRRELTLLQEPHGHHQRDKQAEPPPGAALEGI